MGRAMNRKFQPGKLLENEHVKKMETRWRINIW